jgi:hypothetical protein
VAKYALALLTLWVLNSCQNQTDTPPAATQTEVTAVGEPVESASEVLTAEEVVPIIEAVVASEAVAVDTVLPSLFVQQMISYLAALPQNDDELELDLTAFYPFEMLIGQPFMQWLELYGEPNEVFGTPGSRHVYGDIGSWQGIRWKLEVYTGNDSIINQIYLQPVEMTDWVQAFRIFDALYTKLTDELRRELVSQALAKEWITAEETRALYAYLWRVDYLSPDGYLFAIANTSMDIRQLETLAKSHHIRFNSTATKVAKWQEEFPSSPFVAQGGDSLLTLLSQINPDTLSFYFGNLELDELEDTMLQPNAKAEYWEYAYSRDGFPRLQPSWQIFLSEHRLAGWQKYRQNDFSDLQGWYDYLTLFADFYRYEYTWQGQTIQVQYSVLGDRVVNRSYWFVDGR